MTFMSASRNFAQTWVAKGLFIVLIASFFLWGIGDVLMPNQDPRWAAKVGEATITRDDFTDQYQATVRQISTAFGGAIDPAQARAMGLDRSVLQQMIDRTLIDVGAADLGLELGDDAVRAVVQADPRFHGPQGHFDINVFRRILAQNGLTEEVYAAGVRQQVVHDQLTEAVTAGIDLPPEIVDGVYQFRNETRSAHHVHVADAASADDIAEPDEPTLRAFHTENPGLFTAPEYRTVTAIILTADDLVDRVRVSEAAVEDLFAERVDALATPEQRTVVQFTTFDEDQARAAISGIAAGEDFTTVGTEISGLPADDLVLADVARDQLPPALAEAVFAASGDAVIGPVQSPLGWHVAQVLEISPSTTPTLDELRDELTRELAQDEAIDALIRLTEQLQDTLAAGGSLEGAASQLDVPLRTIPAVDASGLDRAEQPVADLPPRFLDTVLEIPQGGDSPLVEVDVDTYFVARVDAVTPAALIPFETVRADVEQAWRAREKRRLSEQTAEAIVAKIDGGTPLETVAEAEGLAVETTSPVTRRDQAEALPAEFVDRLFETPAGKSFQLPDGTGIIVAQVAAIEPANPAADSDGRGALRGTLVDAARQDALGQLANGLRSRYTVEINPQLFQDVN